MNLTGPPPGRGFPPEHIAQPATAGMNRLLAGFGSAQDVVAYRAWITWWRMNGDSEENLAEAIARADRWAIQMGME